MFDVRTRLMACLSRSRRISPDSPARALCGMIEYPLRTPGHKMRFPHPSPLVTFASCRRLSVKSRAQGCHHPIPLVRVLVASRSRCRRWGSPRATGAIAPSARGLHPPCFFSFGLQNGDGLTLLLLAIVQLREPFQGPLELFPHLLFHGVHARVHRLGDLLFEGQVVRCEFPFEHFTEGCQAEALFVRWVSLLVSPPAWLSASMGVVILSEKAPILSFR